MKATVFVCLLVAVAAKPTQDSNDLELGHWFEGDILVDVKFDSINEGQSVIIDKSRIWENGILYYEFADGYFDDDQKAEIRRALDNLESKTQNSDGSKCLQFVPRTFEDDYVYVWKSGGCSSYVGRTGGAQYMSLENGCIARFGTIMHEFMHALGFYHEHTRGDRDDYVSINFDNITPGAEGNFAKRTEGVNIDHLATSYDYGSVMHYGRYGFAVDPSEETITPTKDPNAEIGQRTRLSDADITRLKKLYNCS